MLLEKGVTCDTEYPIVDITNNSQFYAFECM